MHSPPLPQRWPERQRMMRSLIDDRSPSQNSLQPSRTGLGQALRVADGEPVGAANSAQSLPRPRRRCRVHESRVGHDLHRTESVQARATGDVDPGGLSNRSQH